jgi:hypothetical protein
MAVKVMRDFEGLFEHLVRIGFAVSTFRRSALALVLAGHAGKIPLENRRANARRHAIGADGAAELG